MCTRYLTVFKSKFFETICLKFLNLVFKKFDSQTKHPRIWSMYFAKYVFFSFLSLKLFLCSFWLYMYLKFSIWSTNLIKCTNSICTYLILALCQIGSLFLFLHYFHSFRDDMGVKQCKNIFYKLIRWVFALGVSQNWINFESPPKMKKKTI